MSRYIKQRKFVIIHIGRENTYNNYCLFIIDTILHIERFNWASNDLKKLYEI